ncbi:inositol monophosphatase family protein [Limimaricola sp. G21655-S1]|uniref:inositol monophosphatase family protein n=1 Tax=Limimaricola sp. G21655-S1 TaxID=3014768 RepID=UPI0022AE73EF|nr:inositol monophosphatase family protein [Limimaricola sp. G21655-S1]MCZ4260561.1 inositol monophosphatase family protein [Limimaricola sp. G21655-S1]
MTQDNADLRGIEATAVELATLAGSEIALALGGLLEVRYKAKAGIESLRDPVSEVDEKVERMIRTVLSDRFPDHGIIGEEMDDRPAAKGSAYVWAVDPVDGTTNFINGFPMVAGSIGVLRDGVPVVGAIWCSTGHALRPGVYHGRSGGDLMFEGETLKRSGNSAVRRRLVGLPAPAAATGPWDARKTGSAAIECAFVAAGLLEAARFEAPNIWDVAAGLALLPLVGGTVLEQQDERWTSFEGFGPPDTQRGWSKPLILGTASESTLREHLGG